MGDGADPADEPLSDSTDYTHLTDELHFLLDLINQDESWMLVSSSLAA